MLTDDCITPNAPGVPLPPITLEGHSVNPEANLPDKHRFMRTKGPSPCPHWEGRRVNPEAWCPVSINLQIPRVYCIIGEEE